MKYKYTTYLRQILFIIVFVFNLFLSSTIAQRTLTVEDVEFDVVTGTITGYDADYTDVIIPEKFMVDGNEVRVTAIGEWAFYGVNLMSVMIPSSVTSIGVGAFCFNSLTSVFFESDSYIRVIGEAAFNVNPGLIGITLPSNVNEGNLGYRDIYDNRYEAGGFIVDFQPLYYTELGAHTLTLDDVIFDASTGTIKAYKGGNVRIVIPESFNVAGSDVVVSAIGDWAFTGKSLLDVTIPNTVTSIGKVAFADNFLKNIKIPSSVVELGFGVFYNNSLMTVSIPNSISHIGDWTFAKNSLASVDLSNSITYIGEGAFYSNLINSIEIPKSVSVIKGWAFSENLLQEIVVPDNVLAVEDGAFSKNSLASITIGKSVTTIGEGAFSENLLAEVNLPQSIEFVGRDAFYNNLLMGVSLPTPVVKEGFLFSQWDSESVDDVTGITDFKLSYEAQFTLTGFIISGSMSESKVKDTDILLNISGDVITTRRVNADGTFSFALDAGRSITITPKKEGVVFYPKSHSISNIQSDIDDVSFSPVVTAVENNDDTTISIYPNPVSNILTVVTDDKYYSASVLFLSGVVAQSVNCVGLSEVKINMGHLVSGVYFVVLQGNNGKVIVKKVIKK